MPSLQVSRMTDVPGTESLLRRLSAAVLAVICVFLCACGKTGTADNQALRKYSGTVSAFDTVIDISAWCADQDEFDALYSYADDLFTGYHRLFDIYDTYPGIVNLKNINDAAGTEPLEAGGELLGFLHFGADVCEMTGGNVNIAMGAVLKLWHDAREHSNAFPDSPVLPDEDALREAGRHCSIDALVIDDEHSAVLITDPLTSLDVGALAKGYATEKVAQKLMERGFASFLINAGGNVRLAGSKPSGDWTVAVTNPDRTSSEPYLGTVQVPDCAVVTSGIYQRFFTAGGRCYHHIIDRDTLYPEERYQAVTVICADSAIADAYSTALFNMPADEGEKLVENTEGLEAMWVDYDFTVRMSSGFRNIYKPII